MINDINVVIHHYDGLRLGGERHWAWRQKNVSAPYWRLYWNKLPGGFVRVGAKEWELEPDTVFLMSPGTVYSTRTVDETCHFYVHFSAGSPLDAVAPGFFPLNDRRLQLQAAETATDCFSDRNSWRTVIGVKSLVMSALLRLPVTSIPPPKQYDPRIQKALVLLEAMREIANRELASQAGMSLNSFLLLFQREIGIPPQTWFRRKRLERACELLHFSEATVEEIAAATGFCDRFHLSRAFKTAYGLGPAGYRRQERLLREAGKAPKTR